MLKEIHRQAQEKMKKAIEALEREFKTLRTSRASVGLVDHLVVSAYGTDTPLKGVATITTPDARTIQIQPWDRNLIGAVEKAILAANLGITPNNDGRVIRLTMPILTEERRKELVKVAHKMAEDARVAIRNIRRHANEEIKATEKRHEISEDDRELAVKDIQKLTDDFIKQVDGVLAAKEKEIMEV